MWAFRPLIYKYRAIIEKNEEKLIDGWDMKIDENWEKIKLRGFLLINWENTLVVQWI
jgi:hypothetical protein